MKYPYYASQQMYKLVHAFTYVKIQGKELRILEILDALVLRPLQWF